VINTRLCFKYSLSDEKYVNWEVGRMQNRLFRKGLVVGIICILMMVYIPSINGEKIDYPEEDGPYTVYIGGSISAVGYSEDIDFNSHILPFWYLNNSQCLSYKFRMLSLFYVNGSLQNIKYPAWICLFGFKGFAPSWWLLKWTTIFRNRIIGICDRIFVLDNLSLYNSNQIHSSLK
jgi:hypothetical protein